MCVPAASVATGGVCCDMLCRDASLGLTCMIGLIAQLSTVLQGLGCQRDLLELVKPCFCILPFPPTSALQNVGKGCGFFDSSLACFEEGSLLVLAQVVSKVESLTCRFAWDFGLLHCLRVSKEGSAAAVLAWC